MIERYHMFMDWQSSHSKTGNTDKSYLRTRGNPGKIPMTFIIELEKKIN